MKDCLALPFFCEDSRKVSAFQVGSAASEEVRYAGRGYARLHDLSPNPKLFEPFFPQDGSFTQNLISSAT